MKYEVEQCKCDKLSKLVLYEFKIAESACNCTSAFNFSETKLC